MNGPSMEEILRETTAAIRAQGNLPESPGQMEGGRLTLCAGAIVTDTALRAHGLYAQRADFRRNLLNEGTEAILRFGAIAGLSHDLLRRLIVDNDSCRPEDRVDTISSLLEQLRSGPTETYRPRSRPS